MEIPPHKLLGRALNSVESKYAPKMLFLSGSLEIPLRGIRVSVIGTRNPSTEGINETEEIVKALVKKGWITVSGLARGIDTVAHKTAIKSGGKTIAVIGTPINVTYPRENESLQYLIAKKHLLITQFPVGTPVTSKNFILRNKTMALISNASIIVEAGEKSGTTSQGWETIRLGKLLFVNKKMRELSWVKKISKYGAILFHDLDEIIDLIPLGGNTDSLKAGKLNA